MRAQKRRKTLLRRLVAWLVGKGVLPPLFLKLHAGRRPIIVLRAAVQRVVRRIDHFLSGVFKVDLEDDSAFYDGSTPQGRAAIIRKCKIDGLLKYAQTESSLRLPVLSWLDASAVHGAAPKRGISGISHLTASSWDKSSKEGGGGKGGGVAHRGKVAPAPASTNGKSSESFSSVLLYTQSYTKSDDFGSEIAAEDPALAELIDSSEELIAVQEVGILFEQYRCSTWWWEIVVRCVAAQGVRERRVAW